MVSVQPFQSALSSFLDNFDCQSTLRNFGALVLRDPVFGDPIFFYAAKPIAFTLPPSS